MLTFTVAQHERGKTGGRGKRRGEGKGEERDGGKGRGEISCITINHACLFITSKRNTGKLTGIWRTSTTTEVRGTRGAEERYR